MPTRSDTKSKFGLTTLSRFSKNASSTARRELPRRESKGLSVLTARKLKLATVVTRAAQRFGSNAASPLKISAPMTKFWLVKNCRRRPAAATTRGLRLLAL